MKRKKLTTEQKIGKKIQTLRKTKELSQEELAELVGISRSHMGYIEQGRRNPSFKVMKKLSKIFGVPLGDLFPS